MGPRSLQIIGSTIFGRPGSTVALFRLKLVLLPCNPRAEFKLMRLSANTGQAAVTSLSTGWLPASGGGEEVRAPLMDFLTHSPGRSSRIRRQEPMPHLSRPRQAGLPAVPTTP